MRSCATRSTNLNGPAQTGWEPKFSPAVCAALGDTIAPTGEASCKQRRKWRGQHKLDGLVIDYLDRGDRLYVVLSRRTRHRQMPLDIVLDRSRVERRTIVEFDIWTK